MVVADTARALGLAAVQLHGEEDAAYIRALRPLLPAQTEVWGVAAVGRDLPAPRLGADRTLFDTKAHGQSGGTGLAFDWTRIAEREDLGRGIIAGGLNPDNAAQAAKLGAYALDVSSGVEMAPGRKDPDKMNAFFQALRVPVRGEVQS
jgi:indole-3-glycerol phosphate synthase/phosphoribosylanthranilate isomerase